jgi:hypothetical protein
MQALQPPVRRNGRGLGYSAFARHYLRNHYCFLFLRLLRCFSSPGSPPDKSGYHAFSMVGCPIRKSPDRRLFAPPRSLSQLVTSFIASESQGIRRTPLVTFLTPFPPRWEQVLLQTTNKIVVLTFLLLICQYVNDLLCRGCVSPTL